MKRLIQSIILLLTINTMIMAQEKEQKGFEVTREITIDVSSSTLWNMIGPEFENAYVWASSVDHSFGGGEAEFEGATCSDRYCDVNAKGFNKISERLTKYSDTDMNLSYAVTEGMPGFITHAENDWKVIPLGENRSKLVMNADFRLKGLMGTLMKGMMKNKMEKLLDTVLNDAKVYAETGHVSEVKKERQEKLAKQQTKVAA